MFSVEGKRVIVTGGSRGVGAAVVRSLAQNGAKVAIFDVLDDLGQKLATDTPNVTYFHVDISDEAAVTKAVNIAAEKLGGLDSVHNIAAISLPNEVLNIKTEDLDKMWAVNFKGTLFVSRAAFPFLKTNGGSIINFGSDSGLIQVPTTSAYGCTKAAVHHITRAMAKEWGPYGVRVNAVLPAAATEMVQDWLAGMDEETRTEYLKTELSQFPLGRYGDPERDIAPVSVFLTSDDSGYMTSQLLPLNGGVNYTR